MSNEEKIVMSIQNAKFIERALRGVADEFVYLIEEQKGGQVVVELELGIRIAKVLDILETEFTYGAYR